MALRLAGVMLAVAVFSGQFARPGIAEEAVPCFGADGNFEANQKILETLRKPLPTGGLGYIETPLEEIVAALRDEYEIEIQLDIQALEDSGYDVTQPITVSVRNLSLQSGLELMLARHDLTYVVENEMLLITTQEEAKSRLVIYVYPVRDLIDPSYRPTESQKKKGGPTELIPITESLISAVAYDTWAVNGGGNATIQPLRPGVLVISQTQAVHEEIRSALAAIRRAKQFALHSQSVPEAMGAIGMEGGTMGRGGFGGEGGFGKRGGFGGEFGFGAQPKEKVNADNPFAE